MSVKLTATPSGTLTGVSIMANNMERMIFQQGTRPWVTELQALRSINCNKCWHCGERLTMDNLCHRREESIGLPHVYALYCPNCALGCVRVRIGEVCTYWDNFAGVRAGSAVSNMHLDAIEYPEIVTHNGFLGVKWTAAAWASMYPLGLPVLATMFRGGAQLVAGIGHMLNLVPNSGLPSTNFLWRSGWTLHPLANLRGAPLVDHSLRRSIVFNQYSDYLQSNHNFTVQDTAANEMPIQCAIDFITIAYQRRGASPAIIAEMIQVGTALGCFKASTFNAEAWNSKVQAALGGFGGAERILRKVKR